ncbi:unnamed protein product, partial [Prunus brigantina]
HGPIEVHFRILVLQPRFSRSQKSRIISISWQSLLSRETIFILR